MGFEIGQGALSITFSNEKVEVQQVAQTLLHIEFVYMLLGNMQQGNLGVLNQVLSLREFVGVAEANSILRSRLYDGTLKILSMNMQSPLNINFEGIAKAIKIVVDLFNPTEWKKKKEELRQQEIESKKKEEELRHQQVSNEMQEQKQKYENIRDKITTLRTVCDFMTEFQADSYYDETTKKFIRERVQDEMAKLVVSFDTQQITVIAIEAKTEDEERL